MPQSYHHIAHIQQFWLMFSRVSILRDMDAFKAVFLSALIVSGDVITLTSGGVAGVANPAPPESGPWHRATTKPSGFIRPGGGDVATTAKSPRIPGEAGSIFPRCRTRFSPAQALRTSATLCVRVMFRRQLQPEKCVGEAGLLLNI